MVAVYGSLIRLWDLWRVKLRRPRIKFRHKVSGIVEGSIAIYHGEAHLSSLVWDRVEVLHGRLPTWIGNELVSSLYWCAHLLPNFKPCRCFNFYFFGWSLMSLAFHFQNLFCKPLLFNLFPFQENLLCSLNWVRFHSTGGIRVPPFGSLEFCNSDSGSLSVIT